LLSVKNILTADIGGTNSRFAHFTEDQSGKLSLIKTQWFKTCDFSSFKLLIDQLEKSGFSLLPRNADFTVIAVAGPVERGVYSSPPFISWDIDLSNAERDFGFMRCLLINDFVAQAYACRSPVGESAEVILPGRVIPDASVAVLGAGTALGKAALVPDGEGGFVAVPSEGGHANFPFVARREYEFQEFLIRKLGEKYITANYIVSGRGLVYIHKFLTGKTLEVQEITSNINNNLETLTWASRFYGRICRNYALETVAQGGVYIAGGVAAKTPILLTHEAFAHEFRSSETMSSILEKIPVFLIRNEESGLWGAGFFGFQRLKRA